MELNDQLDQIFQSPTVATADRVLALKDSGRKIIPLHVGDPDFGTPPTVVAAAVSALQAGQTHYCPSRGFLDLRQAIAAKLAGKNNSPLETGNKYDPENEILVAHGGVHAYYLAMQSILNPGDEVLIPDPSWATHTNIVTMLRGDVRHVPAPAEHGFIPLLGTWKKALTEKTRAIVINYPANPTGVCPSRSYFQQLMDFAAENGLWVISDEVYDNLYFNEKPISAGAFPEAKDRTIIINSLSKTYAMTGWRIGYLAAPRQVVDNALKAGQNSITCVAPFVQQAAAFALTDEAVQKAAAEMRAAYFRRREIVMQVVREHGASPIAVTAPMGAFYFFLDFRRLNMASRDICERILEDKGVGLVPGTAFGEQGESFMRMCIAASDSDVEEGMRAILDWADDQKEAL